MPRSLWFIAGAGAGVYAVTKARAVLDTFTVDGLKDRWNSVGVGLAMFRDEVATHSHQRETELRERYGLTPQTLPELTAGTAGGQHLMHESRKREIT